MLLVPALLASLVQPSGRLTGNLTAVTVACIARCPGTMILIAAGAPCRGFVVVMVRRTRRPIRPAYSRLR